MGYLESNSYQFPEISTGTIQTAINNWIDKSDLEYFSSQISPSAIFTLVSDLMLQIASVPVFTTGTGGLILWLLTLVKGYGVIRIFALREVKYNRF